MPFFKTKKKSPSEQDDRKDRAVRRNREAKERFDEALKRLKPMKDISEFLGES